MPDVELAKSGLAIRLGGGAPTRRRANVRAARSFRVVGLSYFEVFTKNSIAQRYTSSNEDRNEKDGLPLQGLGAG